MHDKEPRASLVLGGDSLGQRTAAGLGGQTLPEATDKSRSNDEKMHVPKQATVEESLLWPVSEVDRLTRASTLPVPLRSEAFVAL